MKNIDYTQLSVEELTKRYKTTKVATIMLGTILFFQFLTGIFLSIKQGFSVFTIIPICFFPILIINISSLKKIKSELKSREK
jgi:hypothetical protein